MGLTIEQDGNAACIRITEIPVMTSKLEALQAWVDQVAAHTQPEAVHWCTGSEEEYQDLIELMLATGTLKKLNQDTHPGCFLHLSDPNDVARVEHLTFVCTPEEDDAGPNNLWMPPSDGHRQMDALFENCMQGRVMYVIPYCMGPIDSPYSRCGVEITDSPYVVINMKLMTRMGRKALDRIERGGKFVRGLHSTGELDPERWARWLRHDPIHLVDDPACQANLRRMKCLFFDCGFKDQYHLHYGARILKKKLDATGIAHVYEEFDDNHSGVDYRMDTPAEVANILKTKWSLGLDGGVVIANPVPEKHSLPLSDVERLMTRAMEEAASRGVVGKDLTPYLLRRIEDLRRSSVHVVVGRDRGARRTGDDRLRPRGRNHEEGFALKARERLQRGDVVER